jgi:hypothetical protein
MVISKDINTNPAYCRRNLEKIFLGQYMEILSSSSHLLRHVFAPAAQQYNDFEKNRYIIYLDCHARLTQQFVDATYLASRPLCQALQGLRNDLKLMDQTLRGNMYLMLPLALTLKSEFLLQLPLTANIVLVQKQLSKIKESVVKIVASLFCLPRDPSGLLQTLCLLFDTEDIMSNVFPCDLRVMNFFLDKEGITPLIASFHCTKTLDTVKKSLFSYTQEYLTELDPENNTCHYPIEKWIDFSLFLLERYGDEGSWDYFIHTLIYHFYNDMCPFNTWTTYPLPSHLSRVLKSYFMHRSVRLSSLQTSLAEYCTSMEYTVNFLYFTLKALDESYYLLTGLHMPEHVSVDGIYVSYLYLPSHSKFLSRNSVLNFSM